MSYTETPLTYAIKKKNAEMVEFLIDHGANVNQLLNIHGYTYHPLTIAKNRKYSNPKIVKMLLQHGAIEYNND